MDPTDPDQQSAPNDDLSVQEYQNYLDTRSNIVDPTVEEQSKGD